MNIKTLSKILIAFSMAILLVAINMDTSVSTGYSRVINIGLITQQQNILLIGCISFLAGIILFATAKIKQTPEDDLYEKEKSDAHAAHLNATGKGMTHSIKSYWKSLDNKKGRIFIFAFCTLAFFSFELFYDLSYALSGFHIKTGIPISAIENIFLFGFALYSLIPMRASIVMKHMLFFVIGLAVLNMANALFFSVYDVWETYATALTFVAAFWGIVSIIILRKVNRSNKRKLVTP